MTTLGAIVDRCGGNREETLAQGLEMAARVLRSIAGRAERAVRDDETASTLAGRRAQIGLVLDGGPVRIEREDLRAAAHLALACANAWDLRRSASAAAAIVRRGEPVLSGMIAMAIRRIPGRCVHGIFDPAVSSCECVLLQVSLYGVLGLLGDMRLRAVAELADEWRTE